MTDEAWFHVSAYVSAQSRLSAEERQYGYAQRDNGILQLWSAHTGIA
jgi:hypothetical protein